MNSFDFEEESWVYGNRTTAMLKNWNGIFEWERTEVENVHDIESIVYP